MTRHADNEFCQPCGECEWCRDNWIAHDRVRKLKRSYKRTISKSLELMGEVLLLNDPALEHNITRDMLRRLKRVSSILESLTK